MDYLLRYQRYITYHFGQHYLSQIVEAEIVVDGMAFSLLLQGDADLD